MPMQQPSRPNMGKGNYYPGMGYLPEAKNSTGPDWSQPPESTTPTEPMMSIDEFSKSGLMGPTTMELREPVEFEGGMYDPALVSAYKDYTGGTNQGITPRPGTEAAFGPGLGPDDRPLEPTQVPGNNNWRKMLTAQRMPSMGGIYGMPFYGGGPFYGGMFGMPQTPFYGGLGGFLGGGYGFGGGPMYGGFRRRFDPYQSMMPQEYPKEQLDYLRSMQEYTPPSQEAMTPLLEEFTNFYLDDFQKRNPPTQRSSTMRSIMSPYGIGSLFGGG